MGWPHDRAPASWCGGGPWSPVWRARGGPTRGGDTPSTSGGPRVRGLCHQGVPRHGLNLLAELPAHLVDARIRCPTRIQRVYDPTHEGLEGLARHRRHERALPRRLLGRARPLLPVLRHVFPVGGPQRAPGLDIPRRRVRWWHIRGRGQQGEQPPDLLPLARLTRLESPLQQDTPRGRRAPPDATHGPGQGCRPFVRHRGLSPLAGHCTAWAGAWATSRQKLYLCTGRNAPLLGVWSRACWLRIGRVCKLSSGLSLSWY